MIDVKEVIDGLEMSYKYSNVDEDNTLVPQRIVLNAIALLREQEVVEPEWIKGTPFCGNCGHRLEKKHRNMDGINCPECGRKVKWT